MRQAPPTMPLHPGRIVTLARPHDGAYVTYTRKIAQRTDAVDPSPGLGSTVVEAALIDEVNKMHHSRRKQP
jgi:hypothetical protein